MIRILQYPLLGIIILLSTTALLLRLIPVPAILVGAGCLVTAQFLARWVSPAEDWDR